MRLHGEIIKEVVEKLRQKGILSSEGLIELERILNGPVEDVEDDMLALIEKECDIESE